MFAKNGRYGPYVQWGDPDDPPPGLDKPKMSSLFKTMILERITIDEAEALLQLPRTLGVDPADGEPILANNGRYGPYVAEGQGLPQHRSTRSSCCTITLDEALQIFSQPKVYKRGGAQHGGQGPAARVRHRPRQRACRSSPRTASSACTSPTARPTRRSARATGSRRCRRERAYELLAIRREAIAAKGGPKKKAATEDSRQEAGQEGRRTRTPRGEEVGGQEAREANGRRRTARRSVSGAVAIGQEGSHFTVGRVVQAATRRRFWATPP